ncbi:LOW QUALITY PROTEIN: uncharacterized protein LOC116916887 [Daphnia magna]|uniref:LOW QUALITY PROTEIN: uncharacterized protein LOC116916887 n=1 Tax=Daphnia magna TaxID=35525 RepID=UPI001E1BB414|nr:LOW QUALITY PROTEIN: uncharacterized protein LOC116916887 [Daphnia magna]
MKKNSLRYVTIVLTKSREQWKFYQIIWNRGVDVNVISAYSATALDLVCLTNSKPNAIDLVRLLLQHGAHPNKRSSDSSTPLHKLIWTNHSATLIPLMSLLIQYGADVNARQENDENALHKLLRVNQTPDLLRAVHLLVESGIRMNENGGRAKGFGSALHILCEANQTSHLLNVARCLVESGTCVNLRDDKNNTVLHILCRYNQTDHLLPVMRFFMEAGMTETDVTAKNDQGQTALHVLCQYNQTKELPSAVEFLTQNSIHGSNTSSNSLSALSFVCKYNQTDQLPTVMKLLMPLEDVNQTDYYGSRATHLCAQYQKACITTSLNILADNGADLAATNSDGETILHLACQYADKLNLFSFVSSLSEEIVRKLVDLPDALGRTPLHQAAKSGCMKTVQFLADFVGARVLDANGKCFANYLDTFLRQKGTSLCTCCSWDSSFGLKDIDTLHRHLLSKPIVQATCVPCSIARIEGSIPTHIDDVYIFNATDNYVRAPQSNHWANLLQVWNNLDKKLDFTAVTAVAEIGMRCGRSCVYRNCVWCHLQLSVSSYIRCLIDEVEKLDPRFATRRLIFYGSSAERTKLFQLDEFDFLVVLSHFAEDKDDCGCVSYCGNSQSAFLNYGNGRHGISSGRAVYYFYQLLRAATKRVDCFNIHVRDISFGETCTTLHLTFCGYGQVISISIDITIGISRSNLLRPGSVRRSPASLPDMSSPDNSEEETEYLVPFRDKCGPPEWRLSYPTLERDTLLQTGEEVRMCYRVLKLLVMLCQRSKSAMADDAHQHMIKQKTKPSTYSLKTCLFRYMEFNNPPWSQEDAISHCIGILEVLLTHPGVHLKSFFNPQLTVAYIDHEALAVCSQICDRLRSCVI